MKMPSFAEPQDYLALIVRRFWWVAIPFILLSAAVTVAAFRMPDIYASETMILVEPRDVPDDFVRNLVNLDARQRLNAVKQRILSRTNLLRIYNEFKEDYGLLRGLSDEATVQYLSQNIGIESQLQGGEAPAFKISYQSESAELAQKVTSRLAALFIEYDNRTREQQVFGTTQFLEDELEKVSQRLQEVETVLAEFKQRHRHELPEHLQTNLRTLDQLYIQLQANTEALDRSMGRRLDLERQVSETPPVIVQTVQFAPSGYAADPGGPPPAVLEYREKEKLYKQLNSKYTEKHPDVQRLKAELERLKSEIPPAAFLEIERESSDPSWDEITKPNPIHQNLSAQLSEVRREIDRRQREREWMEAEIRKYSERVQNTAQREQQMAGMVRSYEELNSQYEDLKRKLVQSKLAESLESKQKGEQFVILDPPAYPSKPAKPNRPYIILAGVFLSLGFGCALAFIVDIFDQKLWTHREVEKLLGTSVLAEIPEIITDEDRREGRRKRMLRAAACATFLCLAAGSVYYVVYFDPDLHRTGAAYLDRAAEMVMQKLNW